MAIIKKDIPISTLEIQKQGNNCKIWLNSITGNILRISNINFKNDFDKFNSIDIDCKTNIGTVIDNNYFDDKEDLKELRNFLVLLNQQLINELHQKEKLDFDLINQMVNLVKENDNE